jgi:cytochrome P450
MHTPIGSGFRPPAPTPQPRPLGPLALLKALRTNPLECWTKAHFEEPIVLGRFPFVRYAVVSDPAAIRKILVEDQSAFRKSTIERRVLASRMPNGLVTVDGEQWQRLRRTLAPTFGRSMTGGFAPAIARVAATLVERWQNLSDGGVVEVKAEMSRVALEALVGCIFSEGLGVRKPCVMQPRGITRLVAVSIHSMSWAFPISCRASRGSVCATCCAPFTRR